MLKMNTPILLEESHIFHENLPKHHSVDSRRVQLFLAHFAIRKSPGYHLLMSHDLPIFLLY
jgi:hypothetical protein